MLFFLKTVFLKPKPLKFTTIYCERVPLTEIIVSPFVYSVQFRKRSYHTIIITRFAFGNEVFPLVKDRYAVIFFLLLSIEDGEISLSGGRIWKIKRIGQQSA